MNITYKFIIWYKLVTRILHLLRTIFYVHLYYGNALIFQVIQYTCSNNSALNVFHYVSFDFKEGGKLLI